MVDNEPELIDDRLDSWFVTRCRLSHVSGDAELLSLDEDTGERTDSAAELLLHDIELSEKLGVSRPSLRDAIAEVFPDHELIASLGCQSVINVPVVIYGAVYGTINCLDVAGYYTPDRVAASEALKLPGAAAFLLNRSLSSRSVI